MNETKEPKKIQTPHDRGYKRSLSNPREFLHFIQKYVGADWMFELTEDQLALCDKEFIEKDYEGKEADLLYRINRRDGQEVLIFILQELQSYVDYTMIFRVLVYVVNSLLRYFLSTDKAERERKEFRLPAMVPIVFYNGDDSWTAVRELRKYQVAGESFGNHVLNLEYYLVNLSEIEEQYILSTNTVLDNIMYCDKFRKTLELATAVREAYRRVSTLEAQEKEEFDNWVKYILLPVCGNREDVAQEILHWARNGEEDMAFEYTFIRQFNKEKAEARAEGLAEGEDCVLIRLVCKKLRKGYTLETIADMLEEDLDKIKTICQTAQKFEPDYDVDKVLAAWREHNV